MRLSRILLGVGVLLVVALGIGFALLSTGTRMAGIGTSAAPPRPAEGAPAPSVQPLPSAQPLPSPPPQAPVTTAPPPQAPMTSAPSYKAEAARPMPAPPVVTAMPPPAAKPMQKAKPPEADDQADAARRAAEGARNAEVARNDADKATAMGSRAVQYERSGPLGGNVESICIQQNKCTPVRVFFNTDRKRVDLPKRISYGFEWSKDTEYGSAIVTVPKVVRSVGEINRPSWVDIHIWRVPPEGDPAKHFTIPDGGITVFNTVDDFVTQMRDAVAHGGTNKDHAFIFVHGFDNTFDDALYRTAQITYDLGDEAGPFGTAFLFSWPSRGESSLSGYGSDEDSVRLSIGHLTDFIKLVSEKSGAAHVHVVAHSMGNVALLAALQDIARASTPMPMIDQLILAAPDVDARWFETVAAQIAPVARNTTLYASSRDLAMYASRQFRAGMPRAGDVPPEGPVIARGIETLDISPIDTSVLSVGHAEYAESRDILNDISKVFREGLTAHPPPSRQIYQPAGTADRLFWRYVK